MDSVHGLQGLFSESNKDRFQRILKPTEIVVHKKEKSDELKEVDIDEEKIARKLLKKEKRKLRYVEKDAENGASTDKTVESVKDAQDETENDKDQRTIFIGNIPISRSASSISSFCKTNAGDVESIRIRSVPVSGAKIDQAGNQSLMRKVCVNAKKLGEQKGSFNAYVVFKSIEDASKMLQYNNYLMDNRHLRVDKLKPQLFDPKLSVFLGALPHYADEEELREHFSKVLPNGQDDIVSIRLIRDPETLIGKGIGYLLLKDRDALFKVLTLHQELYKKRWPLRIALCGKITKRMNNDTTNRKTKHDDSNIEKKAKKPRWRDLTTEELQKKISNKTNGAARRIHTKHQSKKLKP